MGRVAGRGEFPCRAIRLRGSGTGYRRQKETLRSRLYGEGGRPRRISLPSYPFARERYWIPAAEGNIELAAFQSNRQLGESFIGQLLQDVMTDAVSVDAAVLEAVKAINQRASIKYARNGNGHMVAVPR
jgi:acyl transferase domain-containing protein